ncbi:glucuronyl esterase domain-containing protein [Niabella hirudinis]|uniref:glucuronyl esterase domain-containing protein n=1 Tax=Niabella hirudinis TaxID=1285929 RepID=UPI003EB7B117
MKRCKIKSIAILLLAALTGPNASMAQKAVNYEESKVTAFELPALLVSKNGTPIKTAQQWEKIRRPELLEIFAAQEYGRTPNEKIAVRYEVLTENRNALSGKATSRQIRFIFSNNGKQTEAILLLYLPNNARGKVPVFVGYNFKGNHSISYDTSIIYSSNFMRVKEPGNPDWARGCQMSRWPLDFIIGKGYALATMCYHDIYPDVPGYKKFGIPSLFSGYDSLSAKPDEWQAIGAWAWGSSRIADYLETVKEIDSKKIAIMGHSRQGKAALWAGAQDKRFGVVISNCSGAGGAALSKRDYGETVEQVTKIKPAWFCAAFNQYRNNEQALNFDQHGLIALMAPRAVYVASAQEDRWADPKGEYLSAFYASPVYGLYGRRGLTSMEQPAIEQPVMNDVGYHIRKGIHDVTLFDWEAFIRFANKHFSLTNGS